MSEQEVCARCRQPKPITLDLQHPNGKRDPLCRDCFDHFVLSGEEWPPQNSKNGTK